VRTITADMLISDVLGVCPHAARVLERHGLGCAGCLAASMESLSSVAHIHGVPVDDILDELNGVLEDAATDLGKGTDL
jgi:hybrid cluster-associated redox disulfide protein